MTLRKRIKNNTLRKILSFLCSFFAGIILFIIMILITFQTTLFNSNYVKTTVDRSSYTELTAEKINKEFLLASKKAGITEGSMFTNMVSSGNISDETTRFINNSLNGTTYEINTDFFTYTLNINLGIYLNKNLEIGLQDKETQQRMEHMITECKEIYIQNVEFRHLPQIGQNVNQIIPNINVAIFTLCVLLAILIGIMISLNFRVRSKLRFIIYSVLTGTILSFACPIWIDMSGSLYRITAGSQSLHVLLNDFIRNIVVHLWINAVILTVITAILFTVYFVNDQMIKHQIKKTKQNMLDLGHEID
ncbi:MAG: hypothetical protein BGN88_08615 [Clostridiales bacterium 43-6]|nr:MAG: hypothetical protein BGN88_08615 [Clostridiales bacterium 43-6]